MGWAQDAPAYANIFMASFESKYIYPYIKEKVTTFLRFIDDLFMIWTGTEEELLKFINELLYVKNTKR